MNLKPTLFLAICLIAKVSLAQTNERLLIKNVTIIPTHINQSFDNKDVIINGDKIELIRSHVENDTAKYDRGVIDGEGKYLMPSMVDAHAHFPNQENIQAYFLMNLINGVGTLRSMRGEEWHLELDQKGKYTPRLILASPPFRRSDSLTSDELTSKVKSYSEKGYDFVKVLSMPDTNQFINLVTASKKYNMKLAGHCSRPIPFIAALESGQYESVEHFHGIAMLREMDDISKATQLSIENGVYSCPTTDWYLLNPSNTNDFKKRKGSEFINNELIAEWDKKLKDLEELPEEEFSKKVKFKEAWFDYRIRLTTFSYREGIPLLVGPDLTGPYGIPGFGYVNELKHFEKAEVSNQDILRAASYHMAQMRGEEMEWGTIRNGAAADLVLLSNNPLDDIENATDIDGIFLRGEYLTTEVLLAELKKLPKLKLE